MYRVSPFVRRFAWALLGGAGVATVWVNLSPASYYDMIEWRFLDHERLSALPGAAALPETFLLTPLTLDELVRVPKWGKRLHRVLGSLPPREMRRALVTAFGNARLDNRYTIEPDDLPRGGSGKSRIGFLQ